VDDEGYVLPDAFFEAVESWYSEDSLKKLSTILAPSCVIDANTYAEGRCKSQHI
jgi:hypothetical protein